MDDPKPIPQLSEADEIRFRELVLQEGVATLTAIRRQMSPVLDEYDDIPLIRKMLEVLEGESTDG